MAQEPGPELAWNSSRTGYAFLYNYYPKIGAGERAVLESEHAVGSDRIEGPYSELQIDSKQLLDLVQLNFCPVESFAR